MNRTVFRLNVFLMMVLVVNCAFSAEQRTYPISLEEASFLALKNNFDIQIARYDAWIARTDNQQAWSIYDTIFTGAVEYQNDQSTQTSTIAGTKAIDNNYNIGLAKKLPFGTTIELDLKNNRHWTNSSFSRSPLTHESTLGATIKQELGRNFLGIQDRGNVKVTQMDVQSSEYTSLEKIEESVADVQKAYWDLVLAMEKAKIQEQMVEQARRLYDLHQEKLKDGLVEIPEAIASEANFEKRKNDLTLTQNQVEIRSNILKLLLNISEEDILFEPTVSLGLFDKKENLEQSLTLAFLNRRDYQRTQNDIQSKDIKLAMKKNNIWPEINLTASLERNGLGDHFKQAVTQITKQDNPNLFAGLEIQWPLENNAAEAQWKAAELDKAKALIQFKLLERKIAIAVADHVRNCNIFHEVAVNQERIANLQKQKLTEEEKKFRYGRSNTDTLIRFQEDAIEAEFEAIEAKYRYHTSIVDLWLAQGTLLNRYWEGGI